MHRGLLAAILSLIPIGFANATVIYDESINGPASDNYKTPTALGALQLGLSTVNGSISETSTGNGNYTTYGDFYTFTVPTNFLITGLSLTLGGTAYSGQWAFLGNTGFSKEDAITMAAYTGNLLQQWDLTAIGAGDYGLYLESDGGDPLTPYSLTFTEAVPEPSTLMLMVMVATLLMFKMFANRFKSPSLE